ncbi:glycosyltransferase [Amycolatopsis sp. NPDC098790]|uniref:glycosyltransferase n=1 Tax=Amycolatopsis sp. NPDC098790 TaxID=3363939 RepID=UPI0037F10FD2
MRILFTTVGLSGHFFPLVPLAWGARALGHDVLVAAPDHFAATVLRAGLPVASSGSVPDFVGLVERDWDVSAVEARRRANGKTFAAMAVASLPGLRELVETWDPDVVVSERAEFAGRVAAGAGIPFAEVHWGVPALPEYRDAATEALRPALSGAALPSPGLVLNPWPAGLRLPHARRHVGFRHVAFNGDARIPRWLWAPRRRPRIGLTLGTVLPLLGPDGVLPLLKPVLARLGAVGAEVVVAVDDAVAADWPPLPGSVRYAGRVPLAQLLRTCDVAIHHGGQGTSLTALDAGVPQLVLPVFDDQLDNAEAVVRAGAGIRLAAPDLTPEAVAIRCETLLEDGGYGRSARRVAAEIAAQASPAEVMAGLVTWAAMRPAA